MSPVEYPARKYLSPSKTSLWEWNDDGLVVTFNAGWLIAFRPELQQILDALSREGLPPLGSVLMLLAACRDGWRDQPKRFGLMTRSIVNSASDDDLKWLRSLCWKLDAVSDLPAERRSGTEAKIALAIAVFEGTRNRTTRDVADEVVRLLDGTSTELFELRAGLLEPYPLSWWKELRPLSEGLESVDLHRLEEFEKTGVDRLPDAAPIEVPEFESVRDLLLALDNDEEFAGLVKLTRHVMAAVAMPRAVGDPEEIPIGGVSDISNRGPFDRLLISELAQDTDVLMTRVALNEALYLRRESPPRRPPNSRIIVLDTGIRLWGIPRLFATAVGLAFAATAERRTDVRLMRVADARLEPVTFRRREDLVDHLSVLRRDLHPGAALPALKQALAQSELAEVILVTARDVVADEDFRSALREAEIPELHVATVTRSGEFQFERHRERGSKRLVEQSLSIDEILEPPQRDAPESVPKSVPVVREEFSPDLPAILFMDPFPLRLSHPRKPGWTWEVPGIGAASVTRDRRLMLWDDRELCGLQLLDSVPRGSMLFRGSSDDFGLAAVFRNGIPVTAVLADRTATPERLARSLRTLELPNTRRRLVGAALWGSKLFLISSRVVATFDLHSGEPEPSMALPAGAVWRYGRFFTIRNQLHALAHNGVKALLEPVFAEGHHVSCSSGFDCPFVGGPVAVSVGGAFVSWDGTTLLSVKEMPIAPPLRVVDTSADGSRILVKSSRDQNHACVDLARESVSRSIPVYLATADSSSAPFPVMTEPSLRSRFREFFVTENRNLAFRGSHDQILEIDWNSLATMLEVKHITHHPTGRYLAQSESPFSRPRRCALPRRISFKLHVCESPGGSRIYVDSRGMIHLKSAHSDIPETTLVLMGDTRVAGWTNTGLTAGPRCITGQPARSDMITETQQHAALRKCMSRFLEKINEKP